jgi:adenylosuccinate synthase
VDLFKNLKPIYEELPGWEESTVGAKSLDELPKNAQDYIQYIEKTVEVPVDIISTGPDREETIIKRHPFST